MSVIVGEAVWQSQTIEHDPRPVAGGEIVVFYKKTKKSEVKSKLEGRPVFVEVIHCKIIQGGDNLSVWDQPVRDIDKEKYQVQWERWLATNENRIPGIPIESWPVLSDIQKAEFRALNIFTVEQFANIADSMASKIMGFHNLRERAKVFIEAGKDAELIGRIRAEADEKMKGQQEQIEKLMAMVQELSANQRRDAKFKPKPRAMPLHKFDPPAPEEEPEEEPEEGEPAL